MLAGARTWNPALPSNHVVRGYARAAAATKLAQLLDELMAQRRSKP
jgi:hypothetical protein